jgi:putative hydrolase of the HAD superfamily
LDTAQVGPQQVVYIEDRPMFVQVAETLGIQGLHHIDHKRTGKQLEKFGFK